MDGIVDKNYVFITVNKVHDRFGAVAAKKCGKKVNMICFFGFFAYTAFSLKHSYPSTGLYAELPLKKGLSFASYLNYSVIPPLHIIYLTHLLQAWTSLSRANSRSVSSLWCMGDHLNSGIRNIVVRGPGLN